MKKLLPLIVILAFAPAGCDNANSEYAGKYTGTFTIVKENTTKSGSVRILSNPLSTNGVLLYGVLPLEYTTTNTFEASSENVEWITQVLTSMVGQNNFINTATEQVKKIHVKAIFTGITNLCYFIKSSTGILYTPDILNCGKPPDHFYSHHSG